jgi:hypothetical protein
VSGRTKAKRGVRNFSIPRIARGIGADARQIVALCPVGNREIHTWIAKRIANRDVPRRSRPVVHGDRVDGPAICIVSLLRREATALGVVGVSLDHLTQGIGYVQN